MIQVKEKWQIILFVFVFQMFIMSSIRLFYPSLHNAIVGISSIFGLIGIILLFVPYLNIYEIKKDKERKKQLQKLYNSLINLKIKSQSKNIQ